MTEFTTEVNCEDLHVFMANSKNLRTTFEIYFILIDFNQTIADFIQQIHWDHFTCMHINSYFYFFNKFDTLNLKII